MTSEKDIIRREKWDVEEGCERWKVGELMVPVGTLMQGLIMGSDWHSVIMYMVICNTCATLL
jgi:hypothetical protein